jgi:hypothetical protein
VLILNLDSTRIGSLMPKPLDKLEARRALTVTFRIR